MTSETLFRIQLVFGYIAWLLCFGTYFWPRLKLMDRADAHRVIATLHSFRFFGLVFILPGIVGPNLPASFAKFASLRGLRNRSAGHPGPRHGQDTYALLVFRRRLQSRGSN
jgi:hypothetical protein